MVFFHFLALKRKFLGSFFDDTKKIISPCHLKALLGYWIQQIHHYLGARIVSFLVFHSHCWVATSIKYLSCVRQFIAKSFTANCFSILVTQGLSDCQPLCLSWSSLQFNRQLVVTACSSVCRSSYFKLKLQQYYRSLHHPNCRLNLYFLHQSPPKLFQYSKASNHLTWVFLMFDFLGLFSQFSACF